jgi:hypothetical protein
MASKEYATGCHITAWGKRRLISVATAESNWVGKVGKVVRVVKCGKIVQAVRVIIVITVSVDVKVGRVERVVRFRVISATR